MNSDLIGSIELTASAAIVIAALSIGFGSNPPTRIRIAVWLGIWFIIVVILAATRALYYEHGLGTPGLGLAVALPIAVLCLIVARVQSLRENFHRVPLWLLVGVHTVRFLGVSFIILFTRYSGRVACLSTDRKRSGDSMDLERDWNRGSARRGRIRRNVLARSSSLDFRRTQLGHHDNPTVALDSRLSGPAADYSSHCCLYSPDEVERRLTSDPLIAVL